MLWKTASARRKGTAPTRLGRVRLYLPRVLYVLTNRVWAPERLNRGGVADARFDEGWDTRDGRRPGFSRRGILVIPVCSSTAVRDLQLLRAGREQIHELLPEPGLESGLWLSQHPPPSAIRPKQATPPA